MHFSWLLHKTNAIEKHVLMHAKRSKCMGYIHTNEAGDSIKTVCDVISEERTIYKLMTTSFARN